MRGQAARRSTIGAGGLLAAIASAGLAVVASAAESGGSEAASVARRLAPRSALTFFLSPSESVGGNINEWVTVPGVADPVMRFGAAYSGSRLDGGLRYERNGSRMGTLIDMRFGTGTGRWVPGAGSGSAAFDDAAKSGLPKREQSVFRLGGELDITAHDDGATYFAAGPAFEIASVDDSVSTDCLGGAGTEKISLSTSAMRIGVAARWRRWWASGFGAHADVSVFPAGFAAAIVHTTCPGSQDSLYVNDGWSQAVAMEGGISWRFNPALAVSADVTARHERFDIMATDPAGAVDHARISSTAVSLAPRISLQILF